MLTGNFGLRVDLAETTTANTTGSSYRTYSAETAVSDITIGTTDKAAALWGYVGANSYQLNLGNIINYSGAGTGIDVRVVADQNVEFSNVKMVVFHNKDTANNLLLVPGAASSFLAASEKITLKPGQGVGLAYGNMETVGATTCVIAVYGSAASTLHEVYVVGN